MYRHSAQVNLIPKNAPPSPDNTSDSESDILDVLDRKRRQLDEEITRFKAAKDREFREFEKELRLNRKKSRGAHKDSEFCPSSKSPSSSSTGATVLTLLSSSQNGPANGLVGHKPIRAGDAVGDKILRSAPLSKPTLSLDKLNVAGETLPRVNGLATPPTASSLTRTNLRSPSPASTNTTPPRSQTERYPPPPTPTSDRTDSFAGVFTPAYLPLLESRDRPPFARSAKPMTSPEEEKERLRHLDTGSPKEAETQKLRLESSQSLPPDAISPSIVATTKRTKSAGQLPSTSLPSALRSSKSGARKGKRVHFQLADFTVVEPSSSYEENSSPGLSPEKQEISDRAARIGEQEHSHSKQSTVGSRRKGSPKHLQLPSGREKRRGRGGRFISPNPSPLHSPSPSPTIEGTSGSPAVSPEESGFTGGLAQADDGGSGVGFFELDEELASPGLREKPLEQELEVDPLPEEAVADEKADGEVGLSSSFAAGSLPIDIVRPSGSWIGSFGH
ncbi:hypothetical protein A1O3_02395 [Capronia epimyces CBS 606.96]|uniref:Uncharacterized protein n=1 Tax=Capronia epimyces CBS 606.96 TaxID=1182542 RepID=W9YA07_9EURO|nr:uncharacterized protein A1O3_02395 [Capronia epimyces CBS 606.96]EXJ89328.1 hypothetical protein A1O3_02395 [Capronia epimyces CBS 606.96]